MQVNIHQVFASFVAKSDMNRRKEFMVAHLAGIEFLQVETQEYKNLQLRFNYFQVDNNINIISAQNYPIVVHPK